MREPCRKWALRNDIYCKAHRCRHGSRNRQNHIAHSDPQGEDLRYARHLGVKLKQRCDELLASPDKAITDLSDEVTLCRSLVGDALDLYSTCDAMPPGEKKTNALLQAGVIVREAISEVADLVMQMSKIEANSKQKLDVLVLNTVVSQVTHTVVRQVSEFCDSVGIDSAPLLLQIAESMEQVSIPTGDEGTDLTADVTEMDHTVPRVIDVHPSTNGGSKNGAA